MVVSPIVPVVIVAIIIFLLGAIPKVGSLIQNIFLLILFLFAIPNLEKDLGTFYAIMIVAVLVFTALRIGVKDIQEVSEGPGFLRGRGIKIPILAVVMGFLFFLLLKFLVSANQGASIIGTPSLAIGSLNFMNASLIAALGIVEQRFFLAIYNVYKLFIKPILDGIITPILSFVIGVASVSIMFAVFHLQAYQLAIGSLIFAFIFMGLSILAFEIPFIGEEPSSFGHYFHNASVSLSRTLSIAV